MSLLFLAYICHFILRHCVLKYFYYFIDDFFSDECFCHDEDKKSKKVIKDPESENEEDTLSAMCGGIRMKKEDFSGDSETSHSNERPSYEEQGARHRLKENDSLRLHSLNGDFARSSSPDSYTFPKKVSDAETRSFGRTRSDVRRNSTCTQMVMETLQFSSFSSSSLRFWLAAFAAFAVKICLTLQLLPIFQVRNYLMVISKMMS